MTDPARPTADPFAPRGGDGSVPAEDDSLRRQPTDDAERDPDIQPTPEDLEIAADGEPVRYKPPDG